MERPIYVYHEYNDDAPRDMITKVSFDKQELLNYMKDRADLFMRSSCKYGCSLEKLQEELDYGIYSDDEVKISDDFLYFRQSTTPEVFRTWVNAVIFLFSDRGYTVSLLPPYAH